MSLKFICQSRQVSKYFWQYSVLTVSLPDFLQNEQKLRKWYLQSAYWFLTDNYLLLKKRWLLCFYDTTHSPLFIWSSVFRMFDSLETNKGHLYLIWRFLVVNFLRFYLSLQVFGMLEYNFPALIHILCIVWLCVSFHDTMKTIHFFLTCILDA